MITVNTFLVFKYTESVHRKEKKRIKNELWKMENSHAIASKIKGNV